MLMFCSLYVFDPSLDSITLPLQPFFSLACMYFFKLFDHVTYFRYIVGKSNPFCIILESLVSYNHSKFRGYPIFLAVNAHWTLIFKLYRKIHSYPNLNEPVSMQNIKFCMCSFLLYVFLFITIPLSGWYILNTYDSPKISMIELCIHSEGAKYQCTRFQSLLLEV